MKEDYYFPHDQHADADPKIEDLIRREGNAGYGIFWRIVERLYRQSGRVSGDYEKLAYSLRTDPKEVERVITGYGLFYLKDGEIGSNSVDRRLKLRESKSNKARNSAIRKWSQEKDKTSMRTHSDRIANALPTHSDRNARNEMKGNEKKGNEMKGVTPVLSLEPERLLTLTWNIRGPHHGKHINQLPADYAAWALGSLTEIGDEYKQALEARLSQRIPAKPDLCMDCRAELPRGRGDNHCEKCKQARLMPIEEEL